MRLLIVDMARLRWLRPFDGCGVGLREKHNLKSL